MALFSPLNLPHGILLLITDGLAAPADFVLHRCLATHLKENNKKSRTVILSVSENISRWKALASKSNLSLQQHLDSGSVDFIDVLAEVQPPAGKVDDAGSAPAFQAIFKRVQDILNTNHQEGNGSGPALVILDDITMLEWIGFPLLEVTRFARALGATCAKANATLLIRHHVVGGSNDDVDDLFRHLVQICTYHLEVRPLASGRSGTVSGEVALHPGFSAPCSNTVKMIPRSAALQYRLTDSGPDFFAKGTSENVL
ncbi:hypothetical protein CPC08DRAFT_818108 [Agrocybe pediades]|nr:hypothetical protein CPC08DRAFT_818108 [Agrocybe pediades]